VFDFDYLEGWLRYFAIYKLGACSLPAAED
jgi:hypothetical protein